MNTILFNENKSLLEIIDVFGQSVGIRYNQKQQHKTKLGGIVTLGIWGFILYNIVNIGIVLVQQDNPSVIQQQNYVKQQPPYQLKPKEFVIAFGLQDAYYKHFFDENIYSIKAQQSNIDRTVSQQGDSQQQQQYTPIQIERCSKNHFQIEQTKEYFYQLPFKDLYCISLNQTRGTYPTIEGEFSGMKFQSIEFQVHECNHSKCNTTAEAKELLRKPTLGVYFQDYNVNITQRNYPFQPIGRNLFWTTGTDMEKDIVISLVNNKIISDFGWVSEEEQVNEQVAYSSQREMVLTRSSSQIFRVTLLYEKNKELLVFRKYLKLIQAFSQVGGLFNFIIAIGYLVCRPFSQIELNRKLLNSLYDIEDNSEEKKIASKNQLNGDLRKSIFSKTFNSPPQQTMQQSNRIKDINAMIESKRNISIIKNDKSNQIQGKQVKQIGFMENLINCIRCFSWCQTPKSRLINYATMNIYNHIDIFNIIRKLIEVDKLKQLLLNEHQIKLFEFLPRPRLQIDTFQDKNYKRNIFTKCKNFISTQQDTNGFFSSELKNEEEEFKALRENYLYVKNNQNGSVFDRNIIKMLDQNLREKLEENLPLDMSNQDNTPQRSQMKEDITNLMKKSQIEIGSCSSISAKLSIDYSTIHQDIKQFQPFSSRNSAFLHSPSDITLAQKPKEFEVGEVIDQKSKKIASDSICRQPNKAVQQNQFDSVSLSLDKKSNFINGNDLQIKSHI